MPLLATPSRQERFADPIALAGLATFAFGCVRFTALAHLGLVLLLVAFVLRVSDWRAVLLKDGLIRLSAFWILWQIGLAAWASTNFPGTAQFSAIKENCFFVFIPLVAMAARGDSRKVHIACLLTLTAVMTGLLMDANFSRNPVFDYELRALGGPRNESVVYIDAGIIGCIALLITLIQAPNRSTASRWAGAALCVASLALLLMAWLSATSRTSLVILPLAIILQSYLAWQARDAATGPLAVVMAGLVSGLILVVVFNIETIAGRLLTDQQTWAALGSANLNAVAADSTGFRIQMWRLAYAHWSAHPLTGVGPNISHLLATANEFPDIRKYTHFHSGFIDTLLRTGVIGLVANVLAAWLVISTLRKAMIRGAIAQHFGHFLICSFLVFVALNATDSIVYAKQSWRFIVLFSGLAYSYRYDQWCNGTEAK